MGNPIKVLLVEDHDLTRQSLTFGLGRHSGLHILGEAVNGQEAVDFVEKDPPDIILMDIVMPVLNGIQATQQIKNQYPEIKVIMLTSHSDREKVFDAFSAGADGYCMKDIAIDRMVQVIESVNEGAVWLDPAIAGFILKAIPLISETVNRADASAKEPAFELSAREKEILICMADGLNNKDIADRLCISLYTVKNHVSNVLQKLSVEDRTQAALMAVKKGLI